MILIKLILFFILSYMISGVVHELGHVIVGLVSKWKFILMVVGPIGLRRNSSDKVELYIEKNPLFWGGVGATLPSMLNDNTLNVWRKVLIGGPIASLIMGVLILPLAFYFNSVYLFMLGSMPLGMGLMCALPVPMKTGFLYVDGYRYKRLVGKGQAYNEEKALFYTTILSFNKQNDCLNIEDINYLTASEDTNIRYYGHHYASLYYASSGDTEKVVMHQDRMNLLSSKVSKIVIEDCKDTKNDL